MTVCPILARERSVEPGTLCHIERPPTSFRRGGVFSSLWACLRRKMRASAGLTGPVLLVGTPQGFISTQDARRRGATSRVRAEGKFVSSGLLAAIAFLAASMVPAHAQSDWTGQFTSNWFLAGNWIGGFPRQTDDGNINTETPNPTVLSDPGALARNLTIGANGTGMLTIQNGGTLADSSGAIGNLPGGVGTVTVTGAGSSWSNAGNMVVGGQGTGTLIIQDGATAQDGVSSGGSSIGLLASSTGTVIVTGSGSSWINGPQAGLNIGSFGTGTLTIANGGRVVDITPLVTNIGSAAGSHGAVTVTGAGSLWSDIAGFRIGNSGTGTLTIADGGNVIAPTVTIAANASSTGTLNIGAGVGHPAAAPGTLTAPSIAFGAGAGTINFNHTSADYVFAPAISGGGTVSVLAGTTVLTADNPYTGGTTVSGGTLAVGDFTHPSAALSGGGPITVGSGGTLGGYGSVTGPVSNSGVIAPGSATPGFSGSPMGAFTINGNYTGVGGTMAINTVLGGDGSPSDRLVISGAGTTATGTTTVHVTNVGGGGAETTGNGIPVVNAVSGATTAPGAFALPAGELRAGAFDYDLFRGGVSGSVNDWFLRSDFVVPLVPIGPSLPSNPSVPLVPLGPSLPSSPPPNPLPPGVAFPIIGPELATYGVVQPLARQLGLSILGTLDDRMGDTYEPDGCAVAPAVAPDSLPTRKPGPALLPARSSRPRSGAVSSAKHSTTTIKPSPIRAPAAILAASRAGSIFCADR